ncbi:fimbria/pilus outer membrane usher protein [Solimonas marina]|uniref:Fimbrial biogenesis outer membrane usher protein n=1 Tax=Solimonas marina TaxID=2714601 RepID=A0A969W864_9GAMM|nr:fimbria/pilus outer membrane usher protein [Solimonas marina]NKF21763.1 fimbrial biogenesis outer membrane usher protein [Solimonas marina]
MRVRFRSGRRELGAALLIGLLGTTPVQAGDGWFSRACTRADDPFPQRAQRLLLRVLASPDDNGADFVLLRMPDGRLLAPPAVFEHLALAAPRTSVSALGARWYALDDLVELHYYVDVCAQTLSIDASALRAADVRSLTPTRDHAAPWSEPGAYLQADTQYLHDRSQDTLNGVIDSGLFGPFGDIRNDVLYDGRRFVRLDSDWTIDDPARLHRLRLGDSITRGGMFGRALRFGGVQWGTEFSLQPDVVTFPLPNLDGLATLPSAVDVYVDGNLRAHESVGSGPFELQRVPVITGAGQMQLVVTDLLGRSSVYRYDFYVTPQLLRAGLDDYSFEVGSPRLDYGSESLHYDVPFVAATWRRGLNDRLTGELHLEANHRRQLAGAGAAWLLPPIGVVSGGLVAGSGDSHGIGVQAAVEHAASRFSYALSYIHNPASLLRLGEDRPTSLQRFVARASHQVGRLGAVSVAWLDDRDAFGNRRRGIDSGFSAALSYGASLTIGAHTDVDNADNNSLYASLTISFDQRLVGSATWQHDASRDIGRLAVQRGRLGAIGWDGSAYREIGDSTRSGANATWTTPQAIARLDAEHRSDDDALRLGLRSGIVTLGNDRFWTRPIDGPFAVVTTDSETPIRVYDENRLSGRADAAHALLVPDLQAYETRQLSVADADYAIDTRLDERARQIVAPGYGGVRVRFGMLAERPTRRLLLRRQDGSAPPAGSAVTISGASASFTGLHGEVLLSAEAGTHQLDVRWSDGHCTATALLAAGDRLSTPQQIVTCTTGASP